MKETYEDFNKRYKKRLTSQLTEDAEGAEFLYKDAQRIAMMLEKECDEAMERSDEACARLQAISDIMFERSLPPERHCPECGRKRI